MRPSVRCLRHLAMSAAMAAAVLAAGCATTAQPPTLLQRGDAPDAPNATSASADITEAPAERVPVVRQGRYTLVELMPEPAQRDLMQQVVEIAIPPTFDASVGDAMRHVLRRTGYHLCDADDATALYALPLPAAHLRLGPLVLRDALLMLAGPAWDLSVDDASRQVCFRRRAAPASASSIAVPTGTVPGADQIQADGPREVQP